MVVAIGLLVPTLWALEEFLGIATRRRLLGIAIAAAPSIGAIWAYRLVLRLAGTAERPRARIGRRAGDGALDVADNGTGFPAEQAGELFQLFKALHGGGLSRHGLGLSIVRRIVERHGGRVWAENAPAPQRGSTFWFNLGNASVTS
jgi:signal transduction histidine kinase